MWLSSLLAACTATDTHNPTSLGLCTESYKELSYPCLTVAVPVLVPVPASPLAVVPLGL